MSNLVSNIFGQPSVDGAACVASESCASGHDGCCAQASAFVYETGAELRYTGPSEVALCDVEHNFLLRPELSLVEHVDLELQQAERRVALAKVDGEESEVTDRERILQCVLNDLTSPLEEAMGRAMLDRGFSFHRTWSPETVSTFFQVQAPIRASECYEVRVLKDVFISLWALNEGVGFCDMIRNFILPMFVARQEVGFRKKAVLYNEFRREQLAYEAEWSQYYAAHGPEVDGYGDDGYGDDGYEDDGYEDYDDDGYGVDDYEEVDYGDRNPYVVRV